MSPRKKLFLWISAFLGVWLFVAVFILGLPWRWAFERRVAEYKARGEPVCAADLAPKTVPAEENGAPLLEAILRDIAAYQARRNASYMGLGKLRPSELLDLFQAEQTLMQKEANEKTELAPHVPEEISARQTIKISPPGHSSKNSPKEQQTLDEEIKIRQQYRDLTQLLIGHPDLLDRFEAALAHSYFHFTIQYKSPSWSILLPHLSTCRDTTNLLLDLSLYYQALGDKTKAQRCRLMLMRTPQLTDADFSLIGSLVHCSLTGIVIYNLGRQLPFLSEKELIALQNAADKLHTWPKSWAEMMLNERVTAVELIELRGAHIDETAALLSSQEKWFWHIYFRSCFRYIDGLSCLDDYDIPINGKPVPLRNELSFMGGEMLPALDSIKAKWQIEAAKIRQLRLGLALELIKRKTGRYPADLSGLDLPKEVAEGKPMKYEVFGEGRGACLEFDNKTNAKTVHFGLGELPEKHPLGEASK
ncbi:MAG: hypothetical protein RL095_2857 [Verrucomicrobiota bacterium]|jgi:hypothetical protein